MGTPGIKFAVDLKQLEVLKKDFQFKAPKNFSYAVRAVLNDQAFATRAMARNNVFPNRFNIRNNFIKSSILVEKVSRSTGNVNLMVAQVGAASKWKQNTGKSFIGMRLQEFGGTSKDPRILSLTARGGSFSKLMIRPFHRLGRAKERSENYPGSNSGRVINMLRQLQFRDSDYFKGPFIIKGHNKIRDGVYVFGKGRTMETSRKGRSASRRRRAGQRVLRNIIMVKDLSFKTIRVKPTYWLKTSMDRAVTPNTTSRFFLRAAQDHLDHVFKKRAM